MRSYDISRAPEPALAVHIYINTDYYDIRVDTSASICNSIGIFTSIMLGKRNKPQQPKTSQAKRPRRGQNKTGGPTNDAVTIDATQSSFLASINTIHNKVGYGGGCSGDKTIATTSGEYLC